MLRDEDLKSLVELRNQLADIADAHTNAWPELKQVLFLAELLVFRRIATANVGNKCHQTRRIVETQ